MCTRAEAGARYPMSPSMAHLLVSKKWSLLILQQSCSASLPAFEPQGFSLLPPDLWNRRHKALAP